MSDYVLQYEIDYQARRSRLTTLFRALIAIPALAYDIAHAFLAWTLVVPAWFALVITGSYPRSLYGIVSDHMRMGARLLAYWLLMTDTYPPFTTKAAPDYPCRVSIGPPQAKYSRLKVAFRWIIGMPTIVMTVLLTVWTTSAAVTAWFVIVLTGRYPRYLYDLQSLTEGYRTRAMAYLALLTDRQPSIISRS